MIGKWAGRLAQGALVLAALVPIGFIVVDAVRGRLGANPVEAITHRTGDWTIRFICFTLCITPLRMLVNRPQVTNFRRMLGVT